MCITREAEATFGRLLAQYKAVLVTGPCQVGKSTMIGLCQGETCGYVMLNDPIALYRATRDPVLFFQDHPLSLVIDEVQYAPELFRCMKLLVDASDKRGRVVLTGSQSYRLMHGVSESLAGCEGIPDLSGISLREELGMLHPRRKRAGRGCCAQGRLGGRWRGRVSRAQGLRDRRAREGRAHLGPLTAGDGEEASGGRHAAFDRRLLGGRSTDGCLGAFDRRLLGGGVRPAVVIRHLQSVQNGQLIPP